MKQYQLVIREGGFGKFWAFYCPAELPPVYQFEYPQVHDTSIGGVLKKARKIKPVDGEVVFTYLDRNKS